jgi:hypothetical protein
MGNNNDLDELGPVDWIVVEFPGSRFNGQIAPALRDLVERDLIRVLDLVVLKKDSDGSLEAFELSDLDEGEIGELQSYEAQLAMLLSEDDVNAIAAAIEPGSSAAVLVWENTWAAPFASAVRHSGGQLVASGRIPTQALLAAIEADEQEEESADEEGEGHAPGQTTHAPRRGGWTSTGGPHRHHRRHRRRGGPRREPADGPARRP